MSIILGQKDDPEVPIMPDAEGTIDQLRVLRQYFVGLLDGSVVGLALVLGGGRGLGTPW